MFKSVSTGRVGGSVDALVVGAFQGSGASKRASLDGWTSELDRSGALAAAAARPEFSGDLARVVEAHRAHGESGPKGGAKRAFVVGLGAAKSFDADAMRLAAAAVGRALADTRAASVSFELAGPLESAGLAPQRAGQAAGEALGIQSFDFTGLRGTATTVPERQALRVGSSSRAFLEGLDRGLDLGRSANVSRFLSATPPNIATPAFIAEAASEMAKKVGLSVRVLEGAALERERMTGLINVGQASINKPCLIRLEYTPGSAARAGGRPLVLIGKTMTYDTGGLSLKVNNGMRGMKGDKDGGCAVLGAMHAIATVIRPKRRVVALLAAAENSVSDNAYRPDDVITFRNGVTVEVTNTDAEGRLVLADALCWACEVEKAAAIVDVATLTGGVVVALGSTYAGMFCEDDSLRAQVEASAAEAGERVWRLPMHREYRDMMKSSVADIINSSPERKAHPIQGAAFLSYFVDDATPWCHLDIAGVHVDESGRGPFAKGMPSGFGVRLLADLAGRFAG